MQDETGNWPKWVKSAANAVKNAIKTTEKALNRALEKTRKIVDIISSNDFASETYDLITNSVELNAGICVGMGLETAVGRVSVEAISRMDIIGVQIRTEGVGFEQIGRSALTVGNNFFSVGPQNTTYENFEDSTRKANNKYLDCGYSLGVSFTFIIGFHINFSFSACDVVEGMVDYIAFYLEE